MSDLGSYEDDLRAGRVERQPGALPPHYPSCFGCGPEAEQGLHIVTRLDGDVLRSTYTFGTEHAGAPGIAHGGLVAAVVDDVCGFSLFVIRNAAVTRKLEVEYLKPVLVGVPYDIEARVQRQEGRKVFVRCEGRSPEGVLTFTGDALFVIVGIEHFAQGTQTDDGQPRVAL